MIDEPLEKLTDELRQWAQAKKPARLFLRDDDACDDTSALRQLSTVTNHYNIPLLLAVIPDHATRELGDFIGSKPHIVPAVHGFSHTNHGNLEEKKIELGGHRPLEIVIAELAQGRDKLLEKFGEKLSPILVPPWNRISKEVAENVGKVGFVAVSGFGWKAASDQVAWVNTHVDIIDWKNDKASKSIGLVLEELTNNLIIARANDYAAIGILTHHLVHDDAAWKMLETLFELISQQPSFEWVEARTLIRPAKSE